MRVSEECVRLCEGVCVCGVCEPACVWGECVSLCVCVRGGGACLCERNRAAEQGLSPLVCEAHRVSTGLGVTAAACNWIRDNCAPACLSLAPLPHLSGSPLLVAMSA